MHVLTHTENINSYCSERSTSQHLLIPASTDWSPLSTFKISISSCWLLSFVSIIHANLSKFRKSEALLCLKGSHFPQCTKQEDTSAGQFYTD